MFGQGYVPVYCAIVVHPTVTFFSYFSEGKLINRSLNRASGLSLPAVLTEICHKMDGNKSVGSHNVFWPGRAAEFGRRYYLKIRA